MTAAPTPETPAQAPSVCPDEPTERAAVAETTPPPAADAAQELKCTLCGLSACWTK